MTTAIRRREPGTTFASPGPRVASYRRRSRPRLPITWPLVTLFAAFPVWWVLGLSAVIWTIITAPLLVALVWRRRTKAPAPVLLWFAFIIWVLMSGLQLTSGTKIITFSYRLTLYICGGLLFLYVYNLPRKRRVDARVLNTLTTFWIIVIIGGYIGILGGSHSFPALLEFLLPRQLRTQPFVLELVRPVLANVETFFGFPVPRPSAPFPYTNNWGGNIAVLTPVALATMSTTRAKVRRRMVAVFLVASLVPMIVSLNRGMFLSLGIGLLYVAIRLAVRGRVATLASLLVLVIGLSALVALTPLRHLVIANLSSTHGHSNTTRSSVAQQAIAGANQSPLLGFGEPQAVTGQGGTPPIGTQGQLWMILYSQGYVATALFIGFFLAILWQTRRAAGTAGLWLHAVPLIALTQITVYGWLPVELQVVMVVAALAYRRCWPLGPAPGQPGRAARGTSSGSPADAGPVRETWPERVLQDPVAVPDRSALRMPDVARDLTRERASPDWMATMPPPGPPSQTASSRSADGEPGGISQASAVVARGSIVNLVAMVAGAAMTFGLVVLVSRWLQPRGAGEFYELVAMFTILSNTFELGADTGLTRWIARARAIGGLEDVRRIVMIAVIPVMAIGIVAAAALWLVAPQASHLFLHGVPVSVGATDIRFIAPLVPLGALSAVIVDGARGFGRMWPYLVIEGVGKPAVRVVAVSAVLMAGLDLHVALVVWGLPIILGLVAACVIFIRIMRKEAPVGAVSAARASEPPYQKPGRWPAVFDPEATMEFSVIALAALLEGAGRQDDSKSGGPRDGKTEPSRPGNKSRKLAVEFWAFTGPRAFQATFQVTVLFLDVLLVGALASTYQAGIYSAVSKLAVLGAFALEGNRLAIAPQLSAMLGLGERGRAAELYQTATRSLVLLTFPLYLMLAIFPAVVLGIFGARYTTGASALAVLSLAMLINLGTGNITVVLLMGGKSSWCMLNAGVALAVNIVLNLLLIPHLGILGAAIAWAASIAIDNLTAVVEVRWLMGLPLFDRGFSLAAGTTLICFGVSGLAARLLLGQTFISLLAAAVAGTASYLLLLYVNRAQLQLAEMARAVRPGGTRSSVGLAQRRVAVLAAASGRSEQRASRPDPAG